MESSSLSLISRSLSSLETDRPRIAGAIYPEKKKKEGGEGGGGTIKKAFSSPLLWPALLP